MLSHEHAASETVSALHSMPAAAPHTEQATGAFEDALEDALDRACAPLIGTVPRADRLKRRQALRQELNALVAAHSELTALPEQAVAEALAHFARLHPAPVLHAASATQTAAQISVHAATYKTTQTASARPATLLSLGLLFPAYVAIMKDWTEALHSVWTGLSEDNLYRIELFAVPLLAGLLVGLLSRHRATRGVFNACALLMAHAVFIPSILVGLSYTHLLPFENSPVWIWSAPNYMYGYCGLVFWPLLGCAGAMAGAKLRQKAGKPQGTRGNAGEEFTADQTDNAEERR